MQKITKEPDVNPPIFQIFMTNQSEIVMFGQVEPVAGLCFAVKGFIGQGVQLRLQLKRYIIVRLFSFVITYHDCSRVNHAFVTYSTHRYRSPSLLECHF